MYAICTTIKWLSSCLMFFVLSSPTTPLIVAWSSHTRSTDPSFDYCATSPSRSVVTGWKEKEQHKRDFSMNNFTAAVNTHIWLAD